MNKTHTEWVKNPKSNRLVKVGGPTWRKLVKEGKVSGIIQNPEVRNKDAEEDNELSFRGDIGVDHEPIGRAVKEK